MIMPSELAVTRTFKLFPESSVSMSSYVPATLPAWPKIGILLPSKPPIISTSKNITANEIQRFTIGPPQSQADSTRAQPAEQRGLSRNCRGILRNCANPSKDPQSEKNAALPLLQLVAIHAGRRTQLGDVSERLTLPARDDGLGHVVADNEHPRGLVGRRAVDVHEGEVLQKICCHPRHLLVGSVC